jgi:hypothetical protein
VTHYQLVDDTGHVFIECWTDPHDYVISYANPDPSRFTLSPRHLGLPIGIVASKFPGTPATLSGSMEWRLVEGVDPHPEGPPMDLPVPFPRDLSRARPGAPLRRPSSTGERRTRAARIALRLRAWRDDGRGESTE